ncbi:methylmalonyl-CoA epimerase [Altericroceibacterium xinjiangense]|uniref:methylmalonyl-CoA epimerase n=1 Tax=Altericroceibacterium xinjiangense TaxID=762261 RepID=UPI000F7E4ED5|nr:methylmalonyl-CoA epimerase [Altericroceibacterium xinjiangense]
MKLGRLNHVGVATPDLSAAIAFHRDVLGATRISQPVEMPEQGVRLCFVDTPNGGTQIELIEPLGDNSPIHGFLARNPAGGQHHLCYEVPDIGAAREWFQGQGKRILGPTRIGAHGTPIFFLHPRDMGGILTEIMESPVHA